MLNEPKSAKVVSISGSAPARPVISLARLPAPVHRVREKATQLFQQTLKNLFDGADDALFNLADKANSNQEQNIYFEAMREIRLKRRELEKSYFNELDRAYAALLSAAVREDDPFAGDLSLDELSLVGNDQLEFQVAVESMVAKALEKVAEPSQHIALRLDSLLPAKVYQRNNPLGPDVLCRSFWAVIESLDVDIKAKLILLKLFDKAVMSQLLKIYGVINTLLIQQNILPSLSTQAGRKSRPTVTPNYGSGSATEGMINQGGIATSGGIANSGMNVASPILEQVRQLLSSATATATPNAAASSGAAITADTLESEQLAQILTSIQHLSEPSASVRQSVLDTSQILKLIQQQGHAKASLSAIDKDVIHLINMLFEFILDDRNLAPTMKALLSRLQIPLLKVAVEDKAFFNVAGHPARRLLNELATAALGWQEPEGGSPSDPLFKKVSTTINAVLEGFETDITLFEDLLTDFIAFIEKEQRRAVVLERRTLDAEDGKAKAEQARNLVAQQMKASINGRAIPACVQEILEGPWHNVLFLQLLKHGELSDEWHESCATVDDLIWSVTAPMNADARSRLMTLLPGLLARLKAGFENIAFSPFEANKLMQQLEAEHLSHLHQVNAEEPLANKEPTANREPSASANREPFSAEEHSFEIDVTEQENSANITTAESGAQSNELRDSTADQLLESVADEPVTEALAERLEQVDRFAQGAWFEVSEEQKPIYRCRLAAIIRPVGKYIFVNRNGMKVAEKSRLELAQALDAGLFQLLDDGMLFDRALESVIGNLQASRGRRA